MAAILVNMVLIALLAGIAIAVLFQHRLFGVAMLSGAYSLIAAILFVVLDAVDVAFTEAAVGAGLSTILALATLSFLPKEEKPRPLAPIPLIVTLLVGALLVVAVQDLPAFGRADAPIHQYVAPDYIKGARDDIGIPNVVTAVLASYRGYDTLGEVVVVFTAGIAVLLILAGQTPTAPAPQRRRKPRKKTVKK